MKAKKYLFLGSGIARFIIFGGILLIFGVMLLVGGMLKNAFLEDMGFLNDWVAGLVELDEKYSYLVNSSPEEIVQFAMSILNTVAIIAIIFALVGIGFGVLNVIISRRYETMFKNKLHKKVVYEVLMWVLSFSIIPNTLATIGLFLRDEPKAMTSKETNTQ